MKGKAGYRLAIGVFFLQFISCGAEREDVVPFAPTSQEVYPEDTVLQSVTPKKAMIIIAHDDDMSSMTGTISRLHKKGWEICVLSFQLGAERDVAHRAACAGILDTVTFFDLAYSQWRLDLGKRKEDELYLPIPKDQFSGTFNQRIVEEELIRRVNEFGPSVLFTLDNEIGAYGHPEHVFLSQLVLDVAKAGKTKAAYIYQSVYTPHMMASIMERHAQRMKEWGFAGDNWEKAKALYHVTGTPLPTTQIHISGEAKEKMDYLKSYNEREQKTIGFFIPAFQEYSAEEYFKIFDREFFNVIVID
jgi:LmbE family N-acetylglucosaminyl deacetylase